ncbi:MAG: response regulator [Candidatus Omnitrophota bacterium]
MDKKPLILIIDDENDLVEMIAYQFKARGYDTLTASNGLEGLEHLKTSKPNLIILDLNMPKMDGITFYQKIADDSGHTSIPVLVLTARANMEQLFKDLDVDGFMSKPFEVDELIHEAELIIKKYARTTETVRHKKSKILRNIFVINNNKEEREKICLGLLEAGYRVASAASGTSGLELLSLDSPVVAVVQLALTDIPGDVVALKGLRLVKNPGVMFLLIEERNLLHDKAVRQRLVEKTGIVDVLEYDKVDEIVHAVDLAIQKSPYDDGAAR